MTSPTCNSSSGRSELDIGEADVQALVLVAVLASLAASSLSLWISRLEARLLLLFVPLRLAPAPRELAGAPSVLLSLGFVAFAASARRNTRLESG